MEHFCNLKDINNHTFLDEQLTEGMCIQISRQNFCHVHSMIPVLFVREEVRY
jgi:hypothetical protein